MATKANHDIKKELKQQFYDAIFAQLDPLSVDITNENLLASVNAASKMMAKSVKRHLKSKKVKVAEAEKPKVKPVIKAPAKPVNKIITKSIPAEKAKPAPAKK